MTSSLIFDALHAQEKHGGKPEDCHNCAKFYKELREDKFPIINHLERINKKECLSLTKKPIATH